MLSPFLISESVENDSADAARGRPIPAAMIAPPMRTRRRDVSAISFALASEAFTLLINRIGYMTSSLDLDQLAGETQLVFVDPCTKLVG
jgi:hypothetical protein